MAEGNENMLKRLGRGVMNFCLIALVLLGLLFGVVYFVVGNKYVAQTDEELCLEDGICAETVMSYEECVKEQGAWVKVNMKMICYKKWSTAYPIMTGKAREL